MRITTKQLNAHAQNQISTRYANLADLQQQISTGKRLLRPSDAPVDVANDLQLRTKQAQLLQLKGNINDGLSFMSITDTAMNGMTPLVQRARELAIQASNDTLGANDRLSIGKEVEQLLRQIVSLGNTQYKGDYVFGGTQTKIPPLPLASSLGGAVDNYARLKMAYYNGAGGVNVAAQMRDPFTGDAITKIVPGSLKLNVGATFYVEGRDYTVDYVNGTITPLTAALAADVSDGGTFAGPNYSAAGFNITFDYVSRGKDIYGDPVVSSGDILREIEPGTVTPINIAIDEAIRDPASGKDLVTAIIRLGQYLLQNNSNGTESSIGEIDKAMQALLSAQTKNGARTNRLETTLDRNGQQYLDTSSLQSKIEDADMAEAISQFSLVENIYNAALKSAAHVIQPSLVDFL